MTTATVSMTTKQLDRKLDSIAAGRGRHKATMAHPHCTATQSRTAGWAGYCDKRKCPMHGPMPVYIAWYRAQHGDDAATAMLAELTR